MRQSPSEWPQMGIMSGPHKGSGHVWRWAEYRNRKIPWPLAFDDMDWRVTTCQSSILRTVRSLYKYLMLSTNLGFIRNTGFIRYKYSFLNIALSSVHVSTMCVCGVLIKKFTYLTINLYFGWRCHNWRPLLYVAVPDNYRQLSQKWSISAGESVE